jgi:hypothetical protein
MDPTIECHPSDEQKEEEDPLAMQCDVLPWKWLVGGWVGCWRPHLQPSALTAVLSKARKCTCPRHTHHTDSVVQ